MNTFTEPARYRFAKQNLVIWIILLMIGLTVIGLLRNAFFDITVLTLQAEPGEQNHITFPFTTVGIYSSIGDSEVDIHDMPSVLEDFGPVDFVCQRGKLFAQKPEEHTTKYSFRLVNNCDRNVVIKVCWFNVWWLRLISHPVC